jgi:hypothetical protein
LTASRENQPFPLPSPLSSPSLDRDYGMWEEWQITSAFSNPVGIQKRIATSVHTNPRSFCIRVPSCPFVVGDFQFVVSNVKFHLLRQELTHFGHQLFAAGGVLAEDARHLAAQATPILFGQILGGDDNDGHMRALG